MKLLNLSTSQQSKILGKQEIRSGVPYRLLHFCMKCVFDNDVVLYNNLTKQLAIIEIESWTKFERSDFQISDEFRPLFENWFLVPVDHDDCNLCDQFLTTCDLFEDHSYFSNYVILTTTDCNARCFYCYEHGVTRTPMTEQTAFDVADYIAKTSKGHPVSIKWFGGEPLYNDRVIDIICEQLTKKGVNFTSRITSNGYLFNKDTVQKAKTKWNLQRVQISLDGTEAVYNRIKAFIYKDDSSPFRTVLGNIGDLLDHDIGVTVRLNVSDHNREDIYRLIDELTSLFAEKPKFNIYASNLFDLEYRMSDDEILRLNDELFKLNDYMFAKLKKHQKINPWSGHTRGCMAQNKRSVVISPLGLLGRCEHYSEGERMYGSIYSDKVDTDSYNYWYEAERIEECKTCVAYPNCLGMTHCPDMSRRCAVSERRIKYRNLENSIKSKYEEIKKESNGKIEGDL